MNQWQPIETAPKDGTPVLLCHERGYDPLMGRFGFFHPNAPGKEAWRRCDGLKISPTHWMPLPDPPEKTT